jgi:hypothetical protein
MSDIFDDRKKALSEEGTGAHREAQAASKRAADREGVAEATGIANEQILEAFREMGLDRETVALLHFVPLLEVAWSDGSMSAKERAGILEMARVRGIMEGSPAFTKLLRWLGTGPTPCSSGGREQ